MELDIRRAELSDLNDIRELNEECWRKTYSEIIPEDDLEENTGNYPGERLRDKIEDDELLFLVAEVNGKTVGTMNFCWGEDNTQDFVDTDRSEAQLRAVYLHPDYWGQGIGTKLFERGLEEILESIKVLKVESLKENDIGRGFYSKLGFEEEKDSKVKLFGDEYDSVIQRKDID